MALTERAKEKLLKERDLLEERNRLLEENAALESGLPPSRAELLEEGAKFRAEAFPPGKMESFGAGALEGATLRLPRLVPAFRERSDKLQTADPSAFQAGNITGAISPQGLPTKIFEGVAKPVNALVGIGEKSAPSILKSALAGSIATPIAAGTEQAIREIPSVQEVGPRMDQVDRVVEAGKGAFLPGMAGGGLAGLMARLGGAGKRYAYNQAFPEEKAIAPEAQKFEARQAAGQVPADRRGPSRTNEAADAAPFAMSRKGTMRRSYEKIESVDKKLQKTIDEVGLVAGEKFNNWNVSRDQLLDEFEKGFREELQSIRLKAGPEAVRAYTDTLHTALGDVNDFNIRDLQNLKRGTAWGNLDDKVFEGLADISARKLALKHLGLFLKDKIENVATKYSKDSGRPDLGRRIRAFNREQGALLEHVDRVAYAPKPDFRRSAVRGGVAGGVTGGVMMPSMGYEAYKYAVPAGVGLGIMDALQQTAPVATGMVSGFRAAEKFGKDPKSLLSALAALQEEKESGK